MFLFCFPSLCPLSPSRWAAWAPDVPSVIDLSYYGLHNSGKIVIFHSSYVVTVFNISPKYLCRDLIDPKIYWLCVRLRPVYGGIRTLGGPWIEKNSRCSLLAHTEAVGIIARPSRGSLHKAAAVSVSPGHHSLPGPAWQVCNSPCSPEKQTREASLGSESSSFTSMNSNGGWYARRLYPEATSPPIGLAVPVSDILIHHQKYWKKVRQGKLGFWGGAKGTRINCTSCVPGTMISTATRSSFTPPFA